ncbi:MAG: nicotinate (nicotinamide) nucleotide adenylyltransferase [Planctomycetaceae bacterium]|nr:nicotinate (nicotinamide) nucleotide adenylyltransferase [Planctomycetaceae bacterium]
MKEITRIILFGGTFDPIHRGHLGVAQHALHALRGDRLVFVPARQSPHKRMPHAGGDDRMAMILCAIRELENIFVSDCELQRSGPSYTIETIRHFRRQWGEDAAIYWLIGADQLADLPKWYRIDELLQSCHLSTMVRAGYAAPEMDSLGGIFSEQAIEQLKRDTIDTPAIPVSSTHIRAELAQGRIPKEQLPPCVADYIAAHGLYGVRP